MSAPLRNIRSALVIGTGMSAKAAITQLRRFDIAVTVADENADSAAREWVNAAGATFVDLPVIDAFLAGALTYHRGVR